MPVWAGRAIKLILSTGDGAEKVLKVIFLAIMLPLALICLVVVLPIVGSKSIPNVNNDKVKMYVETAEKVGKNKVDIDWRMLVAIDSVRYEQDFSKVTLSKIEGLANRFIIEEKHEVIVDKLLEDGVTVVQVTEIEITYKLKPIEKVYKELGLTEEQISDVEIFLMMGLSPAGVDGGISAQAFIQELTPGAIATYKKYKIFPSVTIAQAILESGWGKSQLSSQYFNLFGIKADVGWEGAKVMMTTKEDNGVPAFAYFRVYENWENSIIDHGEFLDDNSRYRRNGVFDAKTYEEQVLALQKAGYSTVKDANGNLIYAKLLMQIINDNNLTMYDK